MMKTLYKNILKRAVILSFLMLSLGILVSCGSSGSSFDEEGGFTELKNLVDSRNFEIENDWANPIGGGRINLIGNPNHIKFQGDSVDVYLPYFGVRHSGGGYNSEGGLKYKGPAREFKVIEKPNKGRIEMEFETDKNGEILEFHISLFPGNKASTNINTTQRTTISYQGEIREIKED